LQTANHYASFSLVLLGGFGWAPVEAWAIASQPWRQLLDSTAMKVQIMTFDVRIAVDENLSLESISEEAIALIECLQRHQQAQQVSETKSYMDRN
jgi:pantothenate kinase